MITKQNFNHDPGTIVDVRSEEEFNAGHVSGSINIPLHLVGFRLDEFKDFRQPLILCCASGNRSGIATMMLQREAIECVNGGGWMELEAKMKKVRA